jgi:hypothetical protein
VRKEEKEDVSEKKRLKRGILKEKRKRRKKRRSGMPAFNANPNITFVLLFNCITTLETTRNVHFLLKNHERSTERGHL